MIERRSILKCLVGLVAAPAIIKVSSLMPVNAGLVPGNGLLTLDQITREAVQRFANSNRMHAEFVRQAHEDYAFTFGEQWPDAFAADGAKIGDILRIRLPNDYVVSDGPSLVVWFRRCWSVSAKLTRSGTRLLVPWRWQLLPWRSHRPCWNDL